MAGCIIITYLYLPETKGRTPAELDAMFEARVPARKFKGKKDGMFISALLIRFIIQTISAICLWRAT